MCQKYFLYMANSVDPDQTSHSVAADVVFTVCKGLSVPILRVIMWFTYTCILSGNITL